MTGWIVALFWFPLLGAGFARAAGIDSPQDRVARFAVSWLVGFAANGVALFALGVAGIPLGLPTLTAIGAAAALAIFAFLPTRGGRRKWPRLPTALMAIPLLAVLVAAAILPVTDYDGRAFWVLKGKAIAHEKAIDGPFFRGKTARNLHSEYPLLVPLAEAAVFTFGGDLDDRHVRPMFALAGIAFLLALRYRLATVSGPNAAAWTAAVLAWLPQLVARPEGSALSAYADLPFAAFFGMAVSDVSIPGQSRRALPLWLAALVLTKSEGIAAAVAILLALVLALFVHRLPRFALLPPAASVAVAAGLLGIWRSRVPLEFDENYAAMIPELPNRLDRLAAASIEFFSRTLAFEAWGLFWTAIAVAVVIALIGDRRRTALIAISAGALLSGAYVVTYAISPWILADLAGSSANRLLLHLIGCGAIVLTAAAPAPENGRAQGAPTA